MRSSAREDRWSRIEARLFASHRARPELTLSAEWQRDLMREVVRRAQTRLQKGTGLFTEAFTGLLFNFARAGVLVAVALCIYARFFAPDLDLQAATLALDPPAGITPLESWLGS